MQGGAGALQETIEEVAGGLPIDRCDRRGIFEHLDEVHKEVVDAIAQLLHVGVLVGGTLVAIHRQALVHHLAAPIKLLAEGLHHQLLQVAAEHLQPIPVGQHHHVSLALAAARHPPGGGQQGGGVSAGIGQAGAGIHGRRPRQEGADVGANQGTGQQAHHAGDAGAAAHPIEQVKAGQPATGLGHLVELAAGHGDGHGLGRPGTAGGLQGSAGLMHA